MRSYDGTISISRERISRRQFFERYYASHILTKRNLHYANERKQRMVVYANDWIGQQIYLDGIYEKELLNHLLKIMQALKIDFAHAVVLDVGANIGNHSLFFAKFFAKVHAFEPDKLTFELLQLNTRESKNVRLHNYGLSNKKQLLHLEESIGNMGGNKVTANHSHKKKGSASFEKLDEVTSIKGNVKLIKIDVEGMEFLALLGGRELIKKHRPVIAFEHHISDFQDSEKESLAIDLLRDLNYSIFWSRSNSIGKSILINRTLRFLSAFFLRNRNIRLHSKSPVPPRNYPMLIAIPSEVEQNLSCKEE